MTGTRYGRPDSARRRQPRWLLAGMAANTLVTLVGTGWLVMTGHAAQADLIQVHDAASRLHTDLLVCDLQDAAGESALIQRRTASARRSTSDFLWNAAARMPLVGHPVRTLQGAAVAADELARTVLLPLTDALPAPSSSASAQVGS
ncbi:hypothetical protein FHS39_004542 [Streptomyces olivoverticillatus]|uniref:Uncharacterized protein n=1 Tax=Streptomyces olivoverticillatus TaxID=66427 RepID=A0A7W7LS40_9ACTN|nr:hypothetical protein [Streptomyces olivoverticillatus]MBB4895464.1 hypothetical protein [Streptomyces olivoverticillatus]